MAFCSPVLATILVLLMMAVVTSSHPTGSHHHGRWGSFRNLTGCRHGSHQRGLAQLKRYFHRFGYLPASPANYSDDFDDDLESALLAYQHYFHLNASGTLDLPTLDLLTKPRCGMPDVINGTRPRGRNLYTFFPNSPKWPSNKRHLTYAFTYVGISLPVRTVVGRAFSRWSASTVFSFSETANVNGADIKISFYTGDHNDGYPFDGMGGTLAHAFSPTDGRLHVDASESWVVEEDVTRYPNSFDLESVMVHEIGHILGLGHSQLSSAIMYPSIASQTKKVSLTNDDVWGIQALYGSK